MRARTVFSFVFVAALSAALAGLPPFQGKELAERAAGGAVLGLVQGGLVAAVVWLWHRYVTARRSK